ncbi:MAG: restriction endonuclease subunit [Ignavibacteria bacterium]|nr:restriction endonuclease subunit [Ignavibacteria bacterium]
MRAIQCRVFLASPTDTTAASGWALNLRFIKLIHYSSIDDWSPYSILGSNVKYNDSFIMKSIGSFLKRNKTPIKIQDNIVYKRPTIKMYNQGIKIRDEEIGKNIGTKNQFLIIKGQFLLSKIDARNGAFGVVPSDCDSAIITGNFWTFDVDYSVINPHFLNLLTSTTEFHKYCQSASVGTTNRNYLQEKRFLNTKIPLPPLEIQNRLVNEYNQLMKTAEDQEAKAKQLEQDIENYLLSELGIEIQKTEIKKGLQFVRFKDVIYWGLDKIFKTSFKISNYDIIKLRDRIDFVMDAFRGKSPKYSSNSNAIILNQKCIRWNEIELEHAKTVDDSWLKFINKNNFTTENDIVINSTGEGTIGRCSVITKPYSNLMYDSHVLLLRLNELYFNPKYFALLFNSKYVQNQINEVKSAQSTKQTELGLDNLFKLEIPLPPLDKQNEIAEKIEAMRTEIKELKNSAESNKAKAKENFEKEIFGVN